MFSPHPLTVLATLAIAVSLILAGCAKPDRHQDIPPHARLASEGDARLSYEAPEDGTVYIYDQTHDRMVYSGKVEAGQMVVVDPGADRITVDGSTAAEERLHRRNRHRIFFEADPRDPRDLHAEEDLEIEVREARPARERDRVIERIEEEEEPVEVQRRRTRIIEREVEDPPLED